MNKIFETNHWIIVGAELIAETSGSCIVVFTGDSAFLYLVIKGTVNVSCIFTGWRWFYYYKFCLSSQVLGSHVSGSQVSDLGFQVPGFQFLILDYVLISKFLTFLYLKTYFFHFLAFYFFNWIKEHLLQKYRCKFKTDEITFSKL